MQINIRCFSCHTPFSVKQEEIEAALTVVTEEGLKHYNAHCPRCGKANKVSKKQLRQAAPKWEPPKKKVK
jgi:ribosomal protein S27AE